MVVTFINLPKEIFKLIICMKKISGFIQQQDTESCVVLFFKRKIKRGNTAQLIHTYESQISTKYFYLMSNREG